MTETLLKPTILPEHPETVELVDDQTVVFKPQFGRGWTQRNSFADPRWRISRAYKALRTSEAAQILAALQDAQGAYKTVRASPSYVNQGTFGNTELYSNPDFSGGTTSWLAQTNVTGTVNSGVYRVARTINDGTTSLTVAPYQALTLTQYLPYVFRFYTILDGGLTSSQIYRVSGADVGTSGGTYAMIYPPGGSATASGLRSTIIVPGVTGSYTLGLYSSTTTDTANDFQSVLWASAVRCALVDASPNNMLQSDDFTTTWTNQNSTDSANTTTDPNGGSTADSLIEDAAVGVIHAIAQAVTVGSGVLDCVFTLCVKASTRTVMRMVMTENISNHAFTVTYNLSTGVVSVPNGPAVTGANWSQPHSYSVSLGNGWWRYYGIARKASAATSISCRIDLATVDGTYSYTGDGVSKIFVWRGGFSATGTIFTQAAAGAGLPFIPALTTTTATNTGTAPTGSSMRLKGLTASTAGLLVPGDYFEINGELKQVTSSVNSDAAGCAVINFRPSLHVPPVDNDPVVFYKPLGMFSLAEGIKWKTTFGSYIDAEIVLDEVYS